MNHLQSYKDCHGYGVEIDDKQVLACVRRGVKTAWVIGDLPFGTYHESPEQALRSAMVLMQAGAHMVKLEGGDWTPDTVHFLVQRGIPVCAHLGLQPQFIHKMGAFKVQGREEVAAEAMLKDAKILEEAGADMLLLECVPSSLGKRITDAAHVPVIGIGAGPDVSGQILVLHDILNISPMVTIGRKPRFVQNFIRLWLNLDHIGEMPVSTDFVSFFRDNIDAAMRAETEMFFRHILDKNLPPREFLAADYTFLNRELALHYGLPPMDGVQLRQVTLPKGERGGLLVVFLAGDFPEPEGGGMRLQLYVLKVTATRILGAAAVLMGILQVLDLFIFSQQNLDFGAAIQRAINDWQLALGSRNPGDDNRLCLSTATAHTRRAVRGRAPRASERRHLRFASRRCARRRSSGGRSTQEFPDRMH